jgi:HD-GYP domain-containing protein (c-di-GMP phosphodiesterase class II)
MADALAFIAWRVAQNMLKSMRKADFDIDPGPQYFEFLAEALPAIRSHHERWDGRGYPDGLAGEAIPLVARIVNAADTWDACTSSRPYQPALAPDEVVRILARLRGTQIDPVVHDALMAVLHRRSNGAVGRLRGAA